MNKKRPVSKTVRATRRTPQKMAVASFLEDNTSHPSAEDIYKALKPRFPSLSPSTVYNSLRSLQAEGRIHEVAVAGGRARFDPEPRPHHHLVCLECGRIVDLDRAFDLALGPDERRGFRVLHNHVGFYGICPVCQAKTKYRNDKEMK